ncbi:hypothetical protein N7451_010227 [Penicillium sp. IBT 35674x]|nr:hypothetical protein N7451_010227 [Penicillium sp. IBT 35674x]
MTSVFLVLGGRLVILMYTSDDAAVFLVRKDLQILYGLVMFHLSPLVAFFKGEEFGLEGCTFIFGLVVLDFQSGKLISVMLELSGTGKQLLFKLFSQSTKVLFIDPFHPVFSLHFRRTAYLGGSSFILGNEKLALTFNPRLVARVHPDIGNAKLGWVLPLLSGRVEDRGGGIAGSVLRTFAVSDIEESSHFLQVNHQEGNDHDHKQNAKHGIQGRGE